MKHIETMLVVLMIAGWIALAVAPASGAPLADNCTKDKGTVTCTTFDGPGNNQGGVGTTTSTDTQGNTSNDSPEPQDLESTEFCSPSTSKGAPCNP
jgi:hypothetical protein